MSCVAKAPDSQTLTEANKGYSSSLKESSAPGQWWCTPLVPALGRQISEFGASLVYRVSSRKTKTTTNQNTHTQKKEKEKKKKEGKKRKRKRKRKRRRKRKRKRKRKQRESS